jgi:neuronal growth regulator 1
MFYSFSIKMKADLCAGYYFLLVACAVCIAQAQRNPQITYISEDQAVNLGSTVELACSVQYAMSYAVQWVKSGKSSRDNYILSTDTSLVVKESRFAALYDGASSTYTVLIKDIQEGDSGEYQCEVILSITNKLVAKTHLTVLRPPIILDNSTQGIISKEGDHVAMECFAIGYPPPIVVWRRENNAILPTGEFKFTGHRHKFH